MMLKPKTTGFCIYYLNASIIERSGIKYARTQEHTSVLYRVDNTMMSHIYLAYYTFSACVAAVKCHPVLHKCVILIVSSSRIMVCISLTFENRVLFMRLKASVVWHFSLPLLNNKLCFLGTFPFPQNHNTLRLTAST